MTEAKGSTETATPATEKEIVEIVEGVVLNAPETFTFPMDLRVERDDCVRRYQGTFKFRAPSWEEEARIGTRYAELCSAWNQALGRWDRHEPLVYHENLALYIATLEAVVTEAPSWALTGGDRPHLALDRIPDYEVLQALYRAYSDWRRTFRPAVQSPAAGDRPE